jgi:preprotein translocase subunit SecY
MLRFRNRCEQLNSLARQTKSGIGSILNMFTGGAFSKSTSVLLLGRIMPYISASIVVQLMELRFLICKIQVMASGEKD